jgi:hypothetical protein
VGHHRGTGGTVGRDGCRILIPQHLLHHLPRRVESSRLQLCQGAEFFVVVEFVGVVAGEEAAVGFGGGGGGGVAREGEEGEGGFDSEFFVGGWCG